MKTLKDIKATMTVNNVSKNGATVTIDGQQITFSSKLLITATIAGVYRQLSQELASGDTQAKRDAILARFTRGYFTEREEKDATRPIVEASKGRMTSRVSFGQLEIIAQARSMVHADDTQSLATLDTIAAYDAEKFGLVLVAIVDKPESLLNRAIKELENARIERENKARAALMETLDII